MYCELWEDASDFELKRRFKLKLKFGSSDNARYENLKNQVDAFDNPIDALNLLADNDWEFCSKATHETLSGYETCYLFKKRIN